MLIDSDHVFKLLIAGADVSGYVDPWSIEFKDSEGGEADTLSFTIRETPVAVVEWSEVILVLDPDTPNETLLFGGFVIKYGRSLSVLDASYSVRAQGYVSLVSRIEMPHRSFWGWLPGEIVYTLFTLVGLTEFDLQTHVTAGTLLKGFVVDRNDKLSSTMDRLAQIAGNWSWRIDANKALHFGPPEDDAAPFGISDGAHATYGTPDPIDGVNYYPASDVDIGVDGSAIVNKVSVEGGSRPSDEITETFLADGVLDTFSLAHRDIYDVVQVTVDGVIYPDGTDWWHTFPERSCLVDYRAGTFRFLNPPADDAEIIVRYSYWVPVVAQAQNNVSIAYYNRAFHKVLVDKNITNEDSAEALAAAYLDEYSYGQLEGSAEVMRVGLRASQSIRCKFDGATGIYVIRSVGFRLHKSKKHLILTVKFGGRLRTFGRTIGELGGGVSSAYQPYSIQPGQVNITPDELGIANISPTEPSHTFPGMIWLQP